MTSNPGNDSHNSSAFNFSSIEHKRAYQVLFKKLKDLEHESVANSDRMDVTMEVLEQTDALTGTSVDTSTALLDSCVLRQAGIQTLTATIKIEANGPDYSRPELLHQLTEGRGTWWFGLPRRVPHSGSLHGAGETPMRPRTRARRRTQAQPLAALRRPDIVASTEEPQEEDTQRVEAVRRWLRAECRRRGAVSLWHCVLDPGSFARTVHNVYNVAFLVQEGKVHLHLDETSGIPMMRMVALAQRDERDISMENQFIVSLDMALWEQLVEVCGIEEPLMNMKALLREVNEGRGR